MSDRETPLPPTPADGVREWAAARLREIEQLLDADGLAIISPLLWGVEHHVKIAVESRESRRDQLFVVLDTAGGIVDVVERIVRVLRQHYSEVKFIIPDRAMSAGTVLAMSGDEIWMDYHSCLGPIDPQVERDGRLEPALSYLAQYERLIEKSRQETLSTAELVLLSKLDLAELHRYELARDLTIQMLKDWLTRYKFKDWDKTETQGKAVTQAIREKRAEEIAQGLSDQQRWLTHSRGIDMRTLTGSLKVRVDDLGERPELKKAVWNYFWFLRSYMAESQVELCVHAPDYF
ncbi:MAG: hypothetical protein OXE79_05265 [Acidimicrobiaceae bacterium]|nr:hypothetical protein [Acidimicrobiaceae bacterium]MCY4281062.1 hypothetical protein [Acidimicrobiaceae bacterium]